MSKKTRGTSAAVRITMLAKHPIAGKTKTRLMTGMSAEHAAAVQEAFVRHWGERLAGESVVPLILFDPPAAADAFMQLMPVALRRYCQAQSKGNLGDRMIAAVSEIDSDNPRQPLFIGSDSPDLPRAMLNDAIRMMRKETIVVGPCEDGGFWGLGLGRGVDPVAVLSKIEWSSGFEQDQVIAAATRSGYDVELAEGWDDIDHPDDLRRLMRHLPVSTEPVDAKLLERLQFLPQEYKA